MSLVGNLEDLELGDILQIVNLSKKSGVLLLSSGQHEGQIVFTDGQVVQAFSSQLKTSLSSILLRHKILDQQSLDSARAAKETLPGRTLADILVSKYKLSSEKIDAIIRSQLERIVYSFFDWKEGSFDFRVDTAPIQGSAGGLAHDLVLERGLNPQWLVAEGRRLVAEGRLISFENEDDLAVDFLSADESVNQESLLFDARKGSPLFIIDDDGPTRSVLQKAFMRAGFGVEAFALTSDLIKACHERVRIGQRPVLLIDLIMPRLDGHGILGGLEVMEIIAEKFADLPMMLMTDHPNAEAEKKAKELGAIAVLRKPKKIEIREERGVEALKNLLIEVDHYLTPGECSACLSEAYDIGKDLVDEFDTPARKTDPSLEGSPGLYLLKGMLQELVNPLLSGGVILLILRFASELLNRAVIFDVDGSELVGIGQFGLGTTTENPDQMVRDLRLKIDSDSLIGQVLRQKVALKGMLGQCDSDKKLKQQLGAGHSTEIFIGPLVSKGKVVAVLYGDNLPELNPIGNVEAFEIFLSQAGMAMEKVLLERGTNDSI